eukprot:1749-Heterococcus_DN1.PRE.1
MTHKRSNAVCVAPACVTAAATAAAAAYSSCRFKLAQVARRLVSPVLLMICALVVTRCHNSRSA